ncbi:MAG TPA: hypothetical protein PK416_07895 [Thermodesulfobacteriota bacterium]|nr:hypothetical protein [Thermodesulfobacteriota bacterium]
MPGAGHIAENTSLITARWGPGSFRTEWPPSDSDNRLDEILRRLRLLTAEPVGALGKFIVEKKGDLWVAEEP